VAAPEWTAQDHGRIAIGTVVEASLPLALSAPGVGKVELGPGSRLRVLKATRQQQRLALDRGTLHARIVAAPEVFIVETRAGVAVDLGCDYSLRVTDEGVATLDVTQGWVALDGGAGRVIVPAGVRCVATPAAGPGTPVRAQSSQALQLALAGLDAASGQPAAADVEAILAASEADDGYSLWHVARRAQGAELARLVDAMLARVAPPSAVTREGLLARDARQWERWRLSLEPARLARRASPGGSR
jgi:hypothetical protein